MKLGTIVRLPDGREGTICYNNLDGTVGVWGRHTFEMPDGGFSGELPEPEFMLRDVSMQGRVGYGAECVGEEFEIEATGGDDAE